MSLLTIIPDRHLRPAATVDVAKSERHPPSDFDQRVARYVNRPLKAGYSGVHEFAVDASSLAWWPRCSHLSAARRRRNSPRYAAGGREFELPQVQPVGSVPKTWLRVCRKWVATASVFRESVTTRGGGMPCNALSLWSIIGTSLWCSGQGHPAIALRVLPDEVFCTR